MNGTRKVLKSGDIVHTLRMTPHEEMVFGAILDNWRTITVAREMGLDLNKANLHIATVRRTEFTKRYMNAHVS